MNSFEASKMSVLPSEIHNALTQLLGGLSSPDNNARSYAEEQLNSEWVAARPDVLLMGLVEHIQVAQEPPVSETSLGSDSIGETCY